MSDRTTDRVVLARECDRYAAHLTSRNAMLDAADLFARCAIALRAAPEPAPATEGCTAEIRYVLNGVIHGRPTATDALDYANARLTDPEEMACCKTDQRLKWFGNVRLLLESAPEPDGWRPIATGPKDGRMVLCWVSAVRYGEAEYGDQPQLHDVSDIDFCLWKSNDGNGYWDNMAGRIGDAQDITHWMPIPSPPTKDGES